MVPFDIIPKRCYVADYDTTHHAMEVIIITLLSVCLYSCLNILPFIGIHVSTQHCAFSLQLGVFDNHHQVENIVFPQLYNYINHLNVSVQERCNSSALAMELHLSWTNPLICAPAIYEIIMYAVYVISCIVSVIFKCFSSQTFYPPMHGLLG